MDRSPDLRIVEALERFTPTQRRDLLRVLTSPAHVRADLIRQCFERDDARHVGEMLAPGSLSMMSPTSEGSSCLWIYATPRLS